MTYRIPPDAVEVTASELRVGLRNWIERVAFGEDELVITRAGKPVVALISMDAYMALRAMLAGIEDQHDLVAAKEARNAGDYVAFDEVLKGPAGGS